MKRGMLLLFLLAMATLVIAMEYVPGEILVFFNDNVDEAQADAMIRDSGLQWTPMFPKGNETGLKMGLVRVPEGQEDLWITSMRQTGIVRRAARNPITVEGKVELVPPSQQVSLGSEANVKIVKKDATEMDYKDYFIMVAAGIFFVMVIVSILLKVEKKYEPIAPIEKKRRE